MLPAAGPRGRKRRILTGLLGIVAALALTCISAPTFAKALSMSDAEIAARTEVGARIPGGRLLWTHGNRVYHTRLGKWDPRPVTPDGVKAARPRWSPDGTRILYEQDGDVWVMDEDFSNRRRILERAHTADWTANGAAVTAILGPGYQVVLYDLGSGDTRVLLDTRRFPEKGGPVSQAAELHPDGRYLLVFREEPHHSTLVVDLSRRRYLANEQMKRGDCAPAWTPDGKEILSTARTTDRPVLTAPFDPGSGAIGPSGFLVGLDSLLRYYAWDARASNDGRWIVFDGKVLIGGAMWGRREIYIWRRGSPQSQRVRLTFDDQDDWEPSLYVPHA